MKKQLLLILIIFLPMMAHPVFSQDIIGIWKCTSSTDVVEGKTITDYMKGQYLTVNADGTYASTSEEMNNGTYTFQGNQFTIKNNKGATFKATVSVNGNQMSMQGTSSYGAEFSYVFERVEQIDFVGTWKCISSYDVVEGKAFTDYMKGQYLTVNADGTYASTSEEMNRGTYTFQGNQFTIKNNKGATFIATVSVDGNQMSMQGTSSYGAEFSYIFEKYGDKTGVRPILSENKTDELYSLSGVKQKTLSKGINIIRQNNGKVKKVMAK